MNGTKPMKMKKDAAMKMKKAAMQLKKEEAAMKLMKEKESAMKMGQSPKKKAAKPDFLDLDKDGNKTESMKKAAADKKNPAMQMKSAMKLKGEAMKMKSPMKNENMKKGSYKGFTIKYPANMTLQDYIRANKAELDKMVARGKK